jgi:hypothetical protein
MQRTIWVAQVRQYVFGTGNTVTTVCASFSKNVAKARLFSYIEEQNSEVARYPIKSVIRHIDEDEASLLEVEYLEDQQ